MAASLGEVIRGRRIRLGLTQQDLAARTGMIIRQSDVSRLERNQIGLPRRDRLEQIATALDYSVGELLAASGWVGAEILDAPPPVSTLIETPLKLVQKPAGWCQLSAAMERAEMLILRCELAVATAEQMSWDVNAALSRRKEKMSSSGPAAS
jgi:transcriptional regulator with XRE-family HTH domain